MSEEKKLLAAVRKIILKFEDGQNHDIGAYDPDCQLCRILTDLRVVVATYRQTEADDHR